VTDISALVAPLLLGVKWLDPQYLLDTFGDYALWGAAAVIFAECGLLVGFFLPGDSLLFTVGLLVSQDKISYPLWVCALVLFVAAMVGNASGYAIGVKVGPKIFAREDSRLFKKKYVDQTHEFFEKYGNRAIVLARFVPIVRTFVPFVAGAGYMSYAAFAFYNVLGAFLWVASCFGLGYIFGNVPIVKKNFSLVAIIIIFISLLPVVWEFIKARRARPAA
jgi:membrane-associated protein